MTSLASKVLAWLCSILLIVSVAATWAYKHQRDVAQAQTVLYQAAVEDLERVAKDRKLTADTLAARVRENAAQARKLAQAQQALSQALQRNPEWAGGVVPNEVRSAILGASEAPVVAAPQPKPTDKAKE